MSSSALNQPRIRSAISKSIFVSNVQATHFVTGGINGNETLTSSEVLDPNGWSLKLPDLPTPISDHCMVQLNSTTAMVIGGFQNKSTSRNTYILNTILGDWILGPPLNTRRVRSGCGRIKKSLKIPEFQIIVVGGVGSADVPSVEILDEETFTWKEGSLLPFGIPDGRLVEDPAGGVILVGGRGDASIGTLDTLYRLSHAEATEWRLMPQRLKVARKFPAAFMIPDGIVDCGLPNSSEELSS